MKRRYALVLGLFVLSLGLPSRLSAQAVGEIRGNVTDPSGAVVPSAKITATETRTAFARSTVTNATGNYSLPSLPVGQYKVAAEAPGFKSGSSDISLDVNQQSEVNFTLALAGTTTLVEVSAAPPLLTTTNATLEGLVTGDQAATLPLNGRDITGLVFLQPGVNQEINGTMYGVNYWSGNGNRGQTNTASFDGVPSGDTLLGGVEFTNYNLDAVAEFKVLQNNYSSQYGHGGGTIISVASRAGTNQFHGSAFEFLRNNILDSRNFFSTSVPPFKRNEFGVTFGGPVEVPRIYNGKGKTFFFLEYAGFRQRRGDPIVESVPTEAERKGIVDITDQNGNVIDHWMVPLNPVSQFVATHYPLPNQPTGPYGPNTFNFEYSVPENHDQWSTRVDHNFSSKDSFFARFAFANKHLPVADSAAAIEDRSFSSINTNDQRNLGLSETHIFSPTFLNTFRFGYGRNTILALPLTSQVTQTTFGDNSLASWGADTFVTGFNENVFSYNDTLNWAKGRHSLNFGGEFVRIQDNSFGVSSSGPNGFYTFLAATTLPASIPSASGQNNLPAGSPSPSALVSFLAGAPSSYNRSLAFPGFGPPGGGFEPFGFRRFSLDGWIQDDFKATRKLTLNLGFRYEYNSVPYEVANRSTGIVDDPHFKAGKLYRDMVLNPQPLYYPDYRGFGPRLGVAYKLTEKTVLRGGYGVFTNSPPTIYPDQAALGFPYASFNTEVNPPYSLTPLVLSGLPVLTDLQGNPVLQGGDTHKIAPNTPVNLVPVAAFFGGPVIINLTSLTFRNGYTMSGNLTLEQELPGDMVLRIGYVSNNAVKLYGSEWPNAYTGAPPQATPYANVNPGLGEFQLTDNHAHSTYNSLQTSLRKTSERHGFQFQASYTWSKMIDNASTVWNADTTRASIIQNNPNCWRCEKGVSGFDFPQALVLNLTYSVPLDKWGAFSSVPRRLTQGWEVASIVKAQSGFPFSVTSPWGTQQWGTDTYVGVQATRSDLIQQPPLRTGNAPEENFFADAVINNPFGYFATPTVPDPNFEFTQAHPGNLGRNTFRSPSFSNLDLSLIKDTRVTERVSLQFRSEFFNLLNQHAFQPPQAILPSVGPGVPLSPNGFGIASATVLNERQIQFGLRLVF